MKLFLLCGRLDGWDDDHATLIKATDADIARGIFVNQCLLADNGYEKGERDTYVHQCEYIGTLIEPDGVLHLGTASYYS